MLRETKEKEKEKLTESRLLADDSGLIAEATDSGLVEPRSAVDTTVLVGVLAGVANVLPRRGPTMSSPGRGLVKVNPTNGSWFPSNLRAGLKSSWSDTPVYRSDLSCS